MTELSPSAKAVLTAVTLKKYDVPPEGLPAFAEEMAPLIAAALHAAAYQLLAVQWKGQIPVGATEQIGINWARDALHVLANELEALNFKKPPSLKEQAMKALDEAVYMADDVPPEGISTDQADTIRRALEALPDD